VLSGFVSPFICRVHTDPGKVWKVLEFNVEIFKDLKTLENDHRYGKVWKIFENCNADLEKARCLLHC